VAHALSLTTDPTFEGKFSAGLDLTQVRRAQVYAIGEESMFGTAAIVEAYDAANRPLGSFFGGFLVGACR
jgi:hypothetical protein